MGRFGKSHRFLAGGMKGLLLLIILDFTHIRPFINSIVCLLMPPLLRNFGLGFRLLIRIYLYLRYSIVIIPRRSLAFLLPILLMRRIGCFNFIILVYKMPNESLINLYTYFLIVNIFVFHIYFFI